MSFAFMFPRRRLKSSPRKAPKRMFESLEKRYLLSSAPVIDFFNASAGAGQTVNVAGHVADYDPNAGALSVSLSGPLQTTVTPDAAGNFSYTGAANGLGALAAVAADAGTGLSSAPAQTAIANAAPQISFSVTETGVGQNVVVSGNEMTTTTMTTMTTDTTAPTVGDLIAVVVAGPDANGNYTWELTGTITDEPGTYTLTLSGLVSGSYTVTTTQSDNHFGVLFSLPEGSSGEITVQATDSSGNVSAPVTYWLMSP